MFPTKTTRRCRECNEHKPKGEFRGESRTCNGCRKDPTQTNCLHAGNDPFRKAVDTKALDAFLRRPLP